MPASASAATVTRYQASLRSPHNALHSPSWASEASPTWAIHLGFFIYYYILSYVRRGLCDPPFFFLRRALCAVQSSCTVLFRCARPTHALHASSIIGASLSEPHIDGISAIFHNYILSYVRRGLCDSPFFFLRRALCGLRCAAYKMDSVDKREKCLQRRRERERSRRASETAEEREERLRKRRVRDRARRAAQSASAREIDLQQRRERSAAESPESREARLQRMRDRVAAETDINVKQTSIYLHVSLRLAPKMSNICLVGRAKRAPHG